MLVRELASAFGHPTQVSAQVQLAPTCDYLPVRLTRASESAPDFKTIKFACILISTVQCPLTPVVRDLGTRDFESGTKVS